jgi:gliding motility-associated-like protein
MAPFSRKHIWFAALAVLLFIGSQAQLVADFDASPLSGCVPMKTTFTDKSTGAPDRWLWDLGEGTISTEKDPVKLYLTPGVYDITLTVFKGAQSSTITKRAYIKANAIPTIAFAATPTNGCSPLQVQFRDSSTTSSGTMTNWQWDFGDGNLGSGKNPIHTYTNTGDFKVTLTATNSDGCSNTASIDRYIKVNPSLTANFAVNYSTVCVPPLTVMFTDQSVGNNIVGYLWDFGDGFTSNLRNPVHVYNTVGAYRVTLTVVNADGCRSTLAIDGAVNVANLAADFVVPGLICAGSMAVFQSSPRPFPSVDSTVWTVSDGTVYRTFNLNKIFVNPGFYTITQTVYRSGCNNSITKTIEVKPRPTATFTSTQNTACKAPLTVTFTNTSPNGRVLNWDFGNGKTSTAETPVIAFDSAGIYTVRLVVINPLGCTDTLNAVGYVQVVPPAIPVIRGLPYDGCGPYTAQLQPTVNVSEAVATWRWDFGDGVTSALQNPTHTWSNNGTYNVTLSITTVSGCTATVTRQVIITAKPTANFTAAPLRVCPSLPVTFTNTSTGFMTAWIWEFGDAGVSYDRNPTYKYNDTGFMTVRLIAFANGCADTITRFSYIYVDPPIAKFKDSVSCTNQFEHFFTNQSAGALTYLWNFGDGTTSTAVGPLTHVYADTGRYVVSLYVADSICNHTATFPVYVLNQKANIVPVFPLSCFTTQVEFTATGPNLQDSRITRYEWAFPPELPFVTDTNFVGRVYPDGSNVLVSLKITDLNGCSDSIIQNVPVRVPVTRAAFGPVNQIICAGSLATFADSSQLRSTALLSNWKWFPDYARFPDSFITRTGAPFSFQYNKEGNYDVKLIVSDRFGCTDSVMNRAVVTVFDPVANFETKDTLVCLNTTVTFLNTSSTRAGTLWYWDFGDGTTSNTDHPTKIYAGPGKYDIRLALREPIGCVDTLVRTRYVVVADAKADFDMSDSFTTCPPFVVNFTNTSASNVINRWDFGNGNGSTLINPAHTYTATGDYKVKLVIEGNGGCTDSITKSVIIRGPVGTVLYSPLNGCSPLQVRFNSSAINTNNYVWDFSDGITRSTTDSFVTHIYQRPGSYVPRVILEDGKGCQIPILGLDTIVVNDTPTIVAGPNPIVCLGQATPLTAIGARSYVWDAHPTLGCTNCATTQATPSGNIVYRVTGTDSLGCSGTDTVLVRVMFPGNLSIAPGDTICIGESVQLRAGGFDRFSWSPTNGLSNPNTANPVARPTVTTLYQVTATDTLNCFSASAVVPVVVYPIPVFNIAESVIIGNVGSVVPLKSSASPDINSWVWTPATGLSCTTCPEPFATIVNRTRYTAVVSNAAGCIAKDEILIEPNCSSEGVFIPNTFSPNGDGNNDLFYPRGTGITRVKNWMIFNRWGELVYEKKDFVLNDPTVAWNGSFRGRQLTPDVFVYTMEVICGNNQIIMLKGNVTLLK